MLALKGLLEKLRVVPLVKALASFKLNLFVLCSLALLVFFGTIYQSKHGLYMAQKVFFDSLIVHDGWLILPGVRLVMWLAFLNLSAFMIFKFKYTWKKIGLIVSHIGLILILVGGFYNLHFSTESILNLREGEQSSKSEAYYDWQILIADSEKTVVLPIDISSNKISAKNINTLNQVFPELKIDKFYQNARIFETPFAGTIAKEFKVKQEYEQNQPCIVLSDKNNQEYFLDNFDHKSFDYQNGYKFILKRKSYELPIIIALEDVERELHPNTQIAKSYSSKIIVKENFAEQGRKAKISMNKPFRYKDYTFFQSGFGIDSDSQEFTSLAVVKNKGRLLPYIASLLTTLGLVVHSLISLFNFLRRKVQN